MGRVAAAIKIEGEPVPDLFLSLLEMEVEDDHELAGVFRIRLSIQLQDDGTWTFLDDDRLAPWKRIEVSASVFDHDVPLITGFVTHMDVHIDTDENSSYLELKGMDATCLMNLEEKIQDWPNQSDSDIATKIFALYQLNAQVDSTDIVHDDTVATIIQRDTDIQFLKRLAKRNGFECGVRGDTAFFQKPSLNGPPQPVLAAFFGPDTNLDNFDARLIATRPAQFEMHQIDSIGKQVLDATANSGQQKQLGRDAANSLTPPVPGTSKVIVRHALATGQQEMQSLCRALYDDAEWLIEAEGEVDTVIYGDVLQSRGTVPIKGVGEIFSGVYYVTSVKHTFTVERYVQKFSARRNAMSPAPGDFGGGGLPFGL